ncbi:glycosyltransferase family 39 protein [Candidatus Sumerlaeota bacterium]|nr:glycosyltransferase family 39 protein [Candidatus Sumerlaeota bacterium]
MDNGPSRSGLMAPIPFRSLLKDSRTPFWCVFALAAALRLPFLFGDVFTPDELRQISSTDPSLPARVVWNGAVAGQSQPPLDYFILWLVRKATGDAQVFQHLHYVLAGILSVPLLYCLLLDIANRRVALLAIFLLAVNPYHLDYSHIVRPYGLAFLLVLVVVWSFFRLQRLNRWDVWLLYALAVPASLLTTTFLAVFIALHMGFILCVLAVCAWSKRKERPSRFHTGRTVAALLVTVSTAIVCLPTILRVKASADFYSPDVSPPFLEQAIAVARLAPSSLLGVLREANIPFLPVLLGLSVLLAVLVPRCRKMFPCVYFGPLGAFVFVLFYSALSGQYDDHVLNDSVRPAVALKLRYLIFALPFMIAGAAWVVDAAAQTLALLARGRVSRRVVAATIPALFVAMSVRQSAKPAKSEFASRFLGENSGKELARLLADNFHDGDLFSCGSRDVEQQILYYLRMRPSDRGKSMGHVLARRTLSGANGFGPYRVAYFAPAAASEYLTSAFRHSRGLWFIDREDDRRFRVRGEEKIRSWTRGKVPDRTLTHGSVRLEYFRNKDYVPETGRHARTLYLAPGAGSSSRQSRTFRTFLAGDCLFEIDPSYGGGDMGFDLSVDGELIEFEDDGSCRLYLTKGPHSASLELRKPGPAQDSRFLAVRVRLAPDAFVRERNLHSLFSFSGKYECLGCLRDISGRDPDTGEWVYCIAYRSLAAMSREYDPVYSLKRRGSKRITHYGGYLSAAYPTSLWIPGEIVIDEFRLPPVARPEAEYRGVLSIGSMCRSVLRDDPEARLDVSENRYTANIDLP